MSERGMIGTALEALEFHGGQRVTQTCYRTYTGAMPDPTFRFNIGFVEVTEPVKMHSHEYVELVIVLGGRGNHLTDYGSHSLEDGEVAVINPGMRHGYRDPQNLKLCLIIYDARQFLSGQRDLRSMTGYHVLFDPAPHSRNGFDQRLHLPAEGLVYVTSLLAALEMELKEKAEGWQTIIRSTFLLLATYLSRLYGRQKREGARRLVRMANVIGHIQQHFREPLAIDELAQVAHLSVSQFERSFKRQYHTTPIHFITQVRLREACEMLQDPNQDITKVALETGFSSSSFFSTQFKRYMGENPSRYRQRKLAELLAMRLICSSRELAQPMLSPRMPRATDTGCMGWASSRLLQAYTMPSSPMIGVVLPEIETPDLRCSTASLA